MMRTSQDTVKMETIEICNACSSTNRKEKFASLSQQEQEFIRANKSIKGKEYRQNNQEKEKERHLRYNKSERGASKRRKRENERLQTDIHFRLNKYIGATIRNTMKKRGSSKENISWTCELPYTVEELCIHIEKQFEPWMNWNNWSKYDPTTWNDNDSTTWAWNIDHIIPISKFQFLSMSDENFKQCWALTNLRPLSAKQNILDGARKLNKDK